MRRLFLLLGTALVASVPLAAAETLDRDYAAFVQPLLKRYCHECHAGEVTEAEIDLASFTSVAHVRRQTKTWLKLREVLDTGDMPPKAAKQPTDAERAQLLVWVRALLAEEARAHAGDPGPVALRRLDNAEYTYVLRDLTGVSTLDPTREFPVDGAAGEGFTNVGSGQGMSPALVQKYLDAAKDVATHLVLLPDGVRFSEATTQRDQTDELLARIQAFYRRYTADGGGTAVNLQGIKFETNQGGLLPLERYLKATLEARAALRAGQTTLVQVAAERGLSPRYLTTLLQALNDPSAAVQPDGADLLLARLRAQWEQAGSNDAAALAQSITTTYTAFWKFNPVGQVGRQGGPTRWLEPVSQLVANHELRWKLTEANPVNDVVFTLTADDLGDGRDHDIVQWQRPRLEFPVEKGQTPFAPLLLKDVGRAHAELNRLMAAELPRTAEYLAALVASRTESKPLETVAAHRQLEPKLLEQWSLLTGLSGGVSRRIEGLFTDRIQKARGYDALNGWGKGETPSLLSNKSDQPIMILTLTVPARGVTIHPSPTQEAFVAWKSPIEGRVKVSGLVADADDKCGNGAVWRVEHRSLAGTTTLALGTFDNGKNAPFQPEQPLLVAAGDVVSIAVGPRDGNHACDTTHVALKLVELDGMKRSWDLAGDVLDDITAANPHPDRQGNAEVWHFGATGTKAATAPNELPAASALAAWRAAAVANQPTTELAARVQASLTTEEPQSLNEADRQVRQALRDARGPLRWLAVVQGTLPSLTDLVNTDYGLDLSLFGKTPIGTLVDPNDLCLTAPQRLEILVPAALGVGAEFVSGVRLHPEAGGEGSVQARVMATKPATLAITPASPILVNPNTPASARWNAACQRFRELFPAALCYSRIVPVDEVVTLTLFYREDDHLRRLMLNDAETAELERLWDELYFVSQEPLKLVVALEQLIQFATQDRQDLVPPFQAMQAPVGERAEKFRKRLLDAEPAQLAAVIALAPRVWRRPVTADEQQQLRALYQRLRQNEVGHVAALELTFARLLTAPAFLFKLEETPGTPQAAPVSPRELANRLSFFLWSSVPDDELLAAAESGRLTEPEELARQTQRMLRDPRSRRLAVHFACQWLHVRDFEKTNDKNERLFPEFAGLKDAMSEETVLFFEDLFRNNGRLLDILEADHTYLNELLAKHYGMAWPPPQSPLDGRLPIGGPGWQRVAGVRQQGRGGILGMATTLASQSGASRTSPILRGNWVYETVLGEKLPKPPPGVPQLPEEVPSGLTDRQLIEQHSSVAACARCHVKIDPYGFALEQFDPIGRIRSQPVDTQTTLVGGQKIEGLAGLRTYLANDRRNDFVRQFSKKLLGYALGRETQLSDEPLLAEIQQRMQTGDGRINVAVEAIVNSPQFRNIRGTNE